MTRIKRIHTHRVTGLGASIGLVQIKLSFSRNCMPVKKIAVEGEDNSDLPSTPEIRSLISTQSGLIIGMIVSIGYSPYKTEAEHLPIDSRKDIIPKGSIDG